jgi:hypothetical protein
MPPLHATANSHGVDWTLELDRGDLVPGRLATGRLRLVARRDLDARGLIAALIATERWQHTETHSDGQGHTSTRTVTSTDELVREPVQLLGPTTLRAGESRDIAVSVPVPPLGPASLDATVCGLSWDFEAKLDMAGGFDSAIVVPVRVLQPTALLRAGVVTVREFALYPAADAETDGAKASVALDPMPLCVGGPFEGQLTIETDKPLNVQEVRLELRVHVKATVSSGLEEDITAWTGRLAGAGQFGGASQTMTFKGDLSARDLPTIELPHGRADGAFHVILARAWARDPHLVRDVAVCSTTEL